MNNRPLSMELPLRAEGRSLARSSSSPLSGETGDCVCVYVWRGGGLKQCREYQVRRYVYLLSC